VQTSTVRLIDNIIFWEINRWQFVRIFLFSA
jgi:hypothetical protein